MTFTTRCCKTRTQSFTILPAKYTVSIYTFQVTAHLHDFNPYEIRVNLKKSMTKLKHDR